MSKLQLSDVTLVVVETMTHGLAKLMIDDCLSRVEFGGIAIYSDNFNILRIPGAKHHLIENFPSKEEHVGFCYTKTALETETSHQLFVEWDAGIVDPSIWKPEFLQYDFIGAPWLYENNNVGNGGFALRSKRLIQFLYDNKDRFPMEHRCGDALLCRQYRPMLEKEGFTWAPDEMAHDFAFEWARPSYNHKHFGYHGMFNWPFVFSPEELTTRVKLAGENIYIKNSPMWEQTLNVAPWLREVA